MSNSCLILSFNTLKASKISSILSAVGCSGRASVARKLISGIDLSTTSCIAFLPCFKMRESGSSSAGKLAIKTSIPLLKHKSPALTAALIPALSPSYNIITRLQKRASKLIWSSVKAVPKLATEFVNPFS